MVSDKLLFQRNLNYGESILIMFGNVSIIYLCHLQILYLLLAANLLKDNIKKLKDCN